MIRYIVRATAIVGLVLSLLFSAVPANAATSVPGSQGSCSSFNGAVKARLIVDGAKATINLDGARRAPNYKVVSTAYHNGVMLWQVDNRTFSGSGLRTFTFKHNVRKGWVVSTKVSLTNNLSVGSCTVKDTA